jgi:hypothetical protein
MSKNDIMHNTTLALSETLLTDQMPDLTHTLIRARLQLHELPDGARHANI